MGGRFHKIGAVCVVLALGLSGCLVSQDPLIGPGEAAFPLSDRVSAERFQPKGDSDWEHDANESARRTGSSYIVTHEDGDEMEVTLKRIAQNTYIAQSKSNDSDYMYGLLVFEPDRIYEYNVDCSDFTAEEAQRYGLVAIKDSNDCAASSAQGLADGYLAHLKKGRKPSGLYVLR